MKEYIDKAAVVAELEKLYDLEYDNTSNLSCGKKIMLRNILLFLNTLDVKEVNVEKESELIANSIMISVQANLYHTNVYDYEKRCYKHSDLKDAARKGIELGLKTKGE